jgi:single-strand DNA-binding protein
MHDEVCFVDCTAWAGRGEAISKYLTKGQPIFVEGRLHYHTWDGPDGKKRSKLDVVIDQFQFIGSKGGGQGGGRPAGQGAAAGAGAAPPQSQDAQRQAAGGAENQAPAAGSEYDFTQDVEDDTIPF